MSLSPDIYRVWNPHNNSMSPADTIQNHLNALVKARNKAAKILGEEAADADLRDLIWLQAIGNDDCDGKAIFCGDIVEIYTKGRKAIGVMIWKNNLMSFGTEAVVHDFKEEELEITDGGRMGHITVAVGDSRGAPKVLGNVFENPDLAEKYKIELKYD